MAYMVDPAWVHLWCYEFPLGTRSFQRLKNQTRPFPFSPRSRLEVFCSLLIHSLHLVLAVKSALI